MELKRSRDWKTEEYEENKRYKMNRKVGDQEEAQKTELGSEQRKNVER
jgi:hypothetical protein